MVHPEAKQKGHTLQMNEMRRTEAQMLAAGGESEAVALRQKSGGQRMDGGVKT